MPVEVPAPSLFSKCKKLLFNREVLTYLIFGVLTTAVNLAVYFGARLFMPWPVANAIAWVIAVEFAYLTNRTFVFRSKGNPIRQRIQFYVSRLTTFGLEFATLFALNVWVGMDDRISKLFAGVLVVIGNYVLSKLFVFRHRDGSADLPVERY